MEDFRSWWAAGFEDLIPIVPPDAPISASSKIAPEQRGKVPGRKNGRGTWGGWDWRRHHTTEQDLERWAQSGASIGLRTAHFPALDIDVLDPELAELIEAIALRILGPAPRRVGRAPKRALAYRTDEPFGRMRLWFGLPGEEHTHLIELLGDGEQYLVDGIHPGTQRPYEWSAHPIRNGGAGALTMIDRAQVEALFVELERILPEHGVVTTREGSGQAAADRSRVDQTALRGDIEAVTEAVTLIPNTNELFPSRTDYLRMGYAIKAACADDPARALELFHDWCARWEGNDRFPLGNEPETVEADWSRMHPPFSIGADWLYEKAQPFGFNAAGEDFEALEAAPASDARPQAGGRPVQFSDAALALRFCKQQGADVRFVTALGRWLIWNGKCWAEDETEQAYGLAVEICSAASSEALRTLPKAKAERIATRVASGSVIGKVHRIARADRLLACTPAAWDANPWILNTPTGVVDLRTSALGPHDRARHCRKITAIGPEKMPTPLWDGSSTRSPVATGSCKPTCNGSPATA